MNVRDFGRVFLMLNYTDITQNTYIQSWTVTETMANEKCELLGCPLTVRGPWRHTRPMRMPDKETPLANIAMKWPWRDNGSAAACVKCLETLPLSCAVVVKSVNLNFLERSGLRQTFVTVCCYSTSVLTACTSKHWTLSQVWTTYLVQCTYISVANMYVTSTNFTILLPTVNDCVLLTLKPQITTEITGSTLSQATKALRESTGVPLLYFRPLH